MDPRRYTPPKIQDPKTAVVTSPPHGQATRRCPNLHSWGGRVPRALSPPISNSVWVRCVDGVWGGAGLGKHAPGESGGVRHPQFFWLVRQRVRGAPACMLSPPTGDGDTAVTPCGTTHPRPSTREGVVNYSARLGKRVPKSALAGGGPAPCHHALIAPPVRVRAKRKGGQGKAGPAPAPRFWARVNRFGSCPPPNLVDNTGEGGGVRRAANPACAHPWAQEGARHVEGAR